MIFYKVEKDVVLGKEEVSKDSSYLKIGNNGVLENPIVDEEFKTIKYENYYSTISDRKHEHVYTFKNGITVTLHKRRWDSERSYVISVYNPTHQDFNKIMTLQIGKYEYKVKFSNSQDISVRSSDNENKMIDQIIIITGNNLLVSHYNLSTYKNHIKKVMKILEKAVEMEDSESEEI